MFTKQISNFAKLGKEKMYNLVKSPDEMIKKVGDSVSDINTQIHNFQKEPNTNFMTSLNKRVPSKQSFQIEKPKDYGLTKKLLHTGHFQMENAGKSSKLLSERISGKSTFKQSAGVPSLNKYFDKLAPKNMDYRYVDPQTYEYKLNGLTQEKLIRNKMREEGEKANVNPDPEVLDSTSKFVNWREQDKVNKVNKIKSVYRNYSNDQALQEADKMIDDGNLADDGDIQNKIKAGRAKRSQDLAPEIQKRKDKEQIAKEALEEREVLIKEDVTDKKERELMNKLESRYTPEQKLIHKLLQSSNSAELLKGTKAGKIEKVRKMMQDDEDQLIAFKESPQDKKDRKEYFDLVKKQGVIDDSQQQTHTAFQQRVDKLSPVEKAKIQKNLQKLEQEEKDNEALQIRLQRNRPEKLSLEDQKKLKAEFYENNKNRMEENEKDKYNEYKTKLTFGNGKKINKANKDVFKALEEQREAKFKEEAIKQDKRDEENAKIQENSRLQRLTKAEKTKLAKEQAKKALEDFQDGAEESKEESEDNSNSKSRYQLRSHDVLIKAKNAKKADKQIPTEEDEEEEEEGDEEEEEEEEAVDLKKFNFSEADKKEIISKQNVIQKEINNERSKVQALKKVLTGDIKKFKDSSTKITKELKNKIEAELNIKIHGSTTIKTVYNNLVKDGHVSNRNIEELIKKKNEIPVKYAKASAKKGKKNKN